MPFSTTTQTALALVPIWLVLWVMVVVGRTQFETSIGDAGEPALLLKIRRHGNFIEWVPFVLILMILAETRGIGVTQIKVAGILLVTGRLAHPFGLKEINANHTLRYVGNGTNVIATMILTVSLARLTLGI